MAAAAIMGFQKEIEALRQEAFAAGYATAMKEVKELTARAAPDPNGPVTSRNSRARNGGRTRARQAAPTSSSSVRRRRSRRSNGFPAGGTVKSSVAQSPRHGTNAVLVAEVLKLAAPRALRAAEIQKALQDNGTTMSFTSIGYSLRRLAARNVAKQGGDGRSWNYLAG